MEIRPSQNTITLPKSYTRLGEMYSAMPTYKDYVQTLCPRNPSLQALHAFLSNPKARRSDCRMIALDFRDGVSKPSKRVIPDIDLLPNELKGKHDKMHEEKSPDRGKLLKGRMIVIEDLTVDIIEILGCSLDIDPLFFAMHLHTARRPGMRHQTTDAATLPSRLRAREYINIPYHRPVTADETHQFGGKFMRDTAIDRKLVFLRSTDIGLVQHRASVIKVQLPNKVWLALVLVDPPLEDTFFLNENKGDSQHKVNLRLQPYMGPYEDFMELPKFSDNWSATSKRPKDNIVDDIIECWDQSTPECFDPSDPTIQSLAFYPLKIVAAEWVKYVAVMQHCIKMYEYHGHQLPGLEKVSTDLRELQGWRRRSMASQQKIDFIIRKLENHDAFNKQHRTAVDDLLEDYRVIGSDIETAGRRLENMLPVLASLVQIIDARQSFAETANISRLTVLALLFVPLSYVSSLFSMNPDNGPGGSHFWVYFAVAVPITIFVFVVARPPIWALRGFAELMWGRRRQRKVLELLNETKAAAA